MCRIIVSFCVKKISERVVIFFFFLTNRDPLTYIFEASVENLQLSLAEVGLSLQLLEALRPVAHHCHLQVIVNFV